MSFRGDSPIRRCDIIQLDRAPRRPVSRRCLILLLLILVRSGIHKTLKPRNRAQRCLEPRPQVNDCRERLVEANEIDHGQADGTFAYSAWQLECKSHEHESNGRNE